MMNTLVGGGRGGGMEDGKLALCYLRRDSDSEGGSDVKESEGQRQQTQTIATNAERVQVGRVIVLIPGKVKFVTIDDARLVFLQGFTLLVF